MMKTFPKPELFFNFNISRKMVLIIFFLFKFVLGNKITYLFHEILIFLGNVVGVTFN